MAWSFSLPMIRDRFLPRPSRIQDIFPDFPSSLCFDPSSAQEAYEMIQEAFEYSEKYKTPVFLRPTTRVCHGYATIDIKDKSEYYHNKPEGFIKDSKRWVIFPKLSFL